MPPLGVWACLDNLFRFAARQAVSVYHCHKLEEFALFVRLTFLIERLVAAGQDFVLTLKTFVHCLQLPELSGSIAVVAADHGFRKIAL